MAFIFYFIVILVSAASVLFGLDLVTSPLPSTPNVPIGRVAHAPAPAHIRQARSKERRAARAADRPELSPIYPAAPRVPKHAAAQVGTGATAPKQAASNEWLPPASSQPVSTPPLGQQQAAISSQPDQQQQAGAPPADATPQPAVAQSPAQCNVVACSAAYRSFRAGDCSYQPFEGPRRTCTRSGGAVTASAAPPRRRRYEGAAPGAGFAHDATDQHELDEVTRIVRKMTRGEAGDIAVQDSRGRIIIVHPGHARAYSPYDSDDGD